MTEAENKTPTENTRITPDDYSKMAVEELRSLLTMKQGVVNELTTRNQLVEDQLRRSEKRDRDYGTKIENLQNNLKVIRQDLDGVVAERNQYARLASILFSQLNQLSGIEAKPSNVTQVIFLYTRALKAISQMASYEKMDTVLDDLFARSCELVLGKKGKKEPVKNVTDFIARSKNKNQRDNT